MSWYKTPLEKFRSETKERVRKDMMYTHPLLDRNVSLWRPIELRHQSTGLKFIIPYGFAPLPAEIFDRDSDVFTSVCSNKAQTTVYYGNKNAKFSKQQKNNMMSNYLGDLSQARKELESMGRVVTEADHYLMRLLYNQYFDMLYPPEELNPKTKAPSTWRKLVFKIKTVFKSLKP